MIGAFNAGKVEKTARYSASHENQEKKVLKLKSKFIALRKNGICQKLSQWGKYYVKHFDA
jgi:hypothetical protein